MTLTLTQTPTLTLTQTLTHHHYTIVRVLVYKNRNVLVEYSGHKLRRLLHIKFYLRTRYIREDRESLVAANISCRELVFAELISTTTECAQSVIAKIVVASQIISG